MYSNNSNRRRIFLVPIFIAVAFFATLIGISLYYQGTTSAYYGPTFFYGWGFFPFGGFFIFPVIFLAFFAFRWIFWGGWGWGWRGYRGYYGNEDPAMETLKQRYARGEITKEQFEQMTKDLEQHV